MSNEELVGLIQQGIDVQENMGKLYEQNKKIIYKFVLPYSSNRVEIDDLMQEAYFGIHQAALKFNMKSEYKFITYAGWWIKCKISKYYMDNKNTKGLPAHIIEKISKYYKFIRNYELDNNEKPNDNEIMDYLEINENQLKSLKKYIAENNEISLQTVLSDEKNMVENVIANDDNTEEEVCEKIFYQQIKKEIWDEVSKLPEKTANIVEQKYKYNKTITDIAKEQKVSYQRIGQIEYEGLKILKEKENLKQIADEYYYNTSMGYKGSFKSFKENGGSVVERLVIKKLNNEHQIMKKIEEIRNKRNKILKTLKVT